MEDDAAIVVRKACKYYGNNGRTRRFYGSKEITMVLDDLNMTVPRGCM
jgi:hypothetical protein